MTTMAIEKYKQRLADVAFAIESGMGYSDLADLWTVSTPAAWIWCHKRLTPEDCAKLAENGRLQVQGPRHAFVPGERANWSIRDRLELVELTRANNWPDAKLARAMGIRPSGLCEWLRRNAPDGVADALSDYAEDIAA